MQKTSYLARLDWLGSPFPCRTLRWSIEASDWLKSQHSGLKSLLTVCFGSLYIAQTGLLDGVRAATSKFDLKILVDGGNYEKFSKVKWVPDARWVVDGKIWTAAGVTSDLDLAAEFASVNFDKDIVELTKNAFEYQPNSDKPDPFAFILQDVQLK
ncbi:hypothetical protein NMY22_g7205 [Coprinellus aureogranulatus]|nr:hypothetical protein NMY22_g7205 [Coprinellus aureogranulatus]